LAVQFILLKVQRGYFKFSAISPNLGRIVFIKDLVLLFHFPEAIQLQLFPQALRPKFSEKELSCSAQKLSFPLPLLQGQKEGFRIARATLQGRKVCSGARSEFF